MICPVDGLVPELVMVVVKLPCSPPVAGVAGLASGGGEVVTGDAAGGAGLDSGAGFVCGVGVGGVGDPPAADLVVADGVAGGCVEGESDRRGGFRRRRRGWRGCR